MRKELLLVVVLLLLAAPAALACEQCISIPAPDFYMCESGHDDGSQWCYGGFGSYCTHGGKCPSPLAAPSGETLVAALLDSSSLTGEAPREGFTLDRAEVAEAVVPEAEAGR